MKTILLLSFIFCSFAHAEKPIAMSDVASAFAWIKLAPEFPVVLTSQSEDQISFRIFDNVYSITREEHDFKIVRMNYIRKAHQMGEDTITIDAMTIEKILKFVKAKNRAEGVLNEDVFQGSIKSEKLPSGFQESLTIYQCKSDLPSRIVHNGSVVNEILQHTWIQNGLSESFGMPNTDDSGYFGGRAHIRTPDSFIAKGPKHLECSPVFIPETKDEKKVSKNIECLARSLSLPQNLIFDDETTMQDWVAHFDYHALKRNCLLAVRFVMECAGAKASQVVNAGIGGNLDWKDLYSVSEVPSELKTEILSLRSQLKKLRDQESISDLSTRSEEIMNQAFELDSRLRGVTGVSSPKNLREICDLALQKCPL